MKLGVIRKTDLNGRIQIPAEMRDLLKITPNNELNVYIEHGKIIVEPINSPDHTCRICGDLVIGDEYYCKLHLERYVK